jgi:hypothetical protein
MFVIEMLLVFYEMGTGFLISGFKAVCKVFIYFDLVKFAYSVSGN